MVNMTIFNDKIDDVSTAEALCFKNDNPEVYALLSLDFHVGLSSPHSQ